MLTKCPLISVSLQNIEAMFLKVKDKLMSSEIHIEVDTNATAGSNSIKLKLIYSRLGN